MSKKENPYVVYSLIDPISNVVRYIGITRQPIKKRYNGHIYLLKQKSKKISWIKSLSAKGVAPIMDIIDDNLIRSVAFKKEKEYIKLYLSAGANLTNYSEGGNSRNPIFRSKDVAEKRVVSAHQKMAMSESMKKTWAEKKKKGSFTTNKGYKHTEETKIKMSLAKKGKPIMHLLKPISEESRLKMSLAKIGKKASPETIHKLRECRKGEKNPFFGKKHSSKTIEKLKGRVPAIKGKKRADGGGMIGKKHSEETKAKMRAAQIGRIVSEQSRIHQSIAAKKAWQNKENHKSRRKD